jgi:hypothetical protein
MKKTSPELGCTYSGSCSYNNTRTMKCWIETIKPPKNTILSMRDRFNVSGSLC